MRLHHVNLGVPPGGIEDEESFVTGVLGYRPVALSPADQARGVHWFETDDGTQIHLSEDPEHRAAARAHVALEVGDDLDAIRGRLVERAWKFAAAENPEGLAVVLCKDPAGNRFELRGAPVG